MERPKSCDLSAHECAALVADDGGDFHSILTDKISDPLIKKSTHCCVSWDDVPAAVCSCIPLERGIAKIIFFASQRETLQFWIVFRRDVISGSSG